MSQYISSAGDGVIKVPSVALLPTQANSGALALTLDTDDLYVFNGVAWEVLANGGSSGGTVTSVGLALPAGIFTVSGSPVTTAGTLTGSLNTQTANIVLAGPTSGGAATPTFRALVTADIPNISLTTGVSGILPIANGGTNSGTALGNNLVIVSLAGAIKESSTTTTQLSFLDATSSIQTQLNSKGSGTVTSVALTVPSILSVAGSPITTSGTLALTLSTQTANTIFAGPTSGGATTPTFRTLVTADIPNISLTTGVSGVLPIANGGTNSSSSLSNGKVIVSVAGAIIESATTTTQLSFLDATSSIQTQINSKGSGTVTSVALTVPSILSVSGSPVTTSGTLAVTLATQTANTVFAGPTSGGAATPAFRALVSADLPTAATTTKTANYTITTTDSIIFVDTSGGAFTLTLPSPTAGKVFQLIDTKGTLSTNNLTLAPSAAEKISGIAASKLFSTDWGGWRIVTNGTDWYVM